MTMKIQPISIYRQIVIPRTDRQINYQNETKTQNLSEYSGTKAMSYFPLSFKSSEGIKSLSEELMELDNIHCPTCGIKLLNPNEMKKLAVKSKKIDTPEKFVNFLQEYNESIPKKYKRVLDSAQRNAQLTCVRTIPDLIDIMHDAAVISLDKSIDKTIDIIQDYKNKCNFSDSDNVLLEEFEIRLKALDTQNNDKLLPVFQKALKETIGNLEYSDREELRQNIVKEILPDLFYHHLFPVRKDCFDDKYYKKKFVQRIFDSAFSNVQKIVTVPEGEEFSANRILTCKDCWVAPPYQYLKENMKKENFEKNFSRHIEEIAQNVLEGKLQSEKKYPLMLRGFVFKLSQGHIKIDKTKYPALKAVQTQVFEESQKILDFDPVNHSGVPCSSCGTITLTHKEKLDLMEKAKNAADITELVGILKKNERHLDVKNKQILAEMEDILNKNPDISEHEFIKQLKILADAEIKKQLTGNIAVCKIMEHGLAGQDRKYLLQYVDEVQNKYLKCSCNQMFPYQDYMDLVRETIYKIQEDGIRRHYNNKFKESVRNAYTKQTLLFPVPELVQKIGSPLKVAVQNMFKGSVATIDHFVPKNKKGDNDFSNLTVMCRNCNAEKTNYSMKKWLILNPKWPQNLQNYVNEIGRMIKVGQLDRSYEQYLKDLIENTTNLSEGRIHLHYTPKTPIKKPKIKNSK